jgi:hypothetical protein
MSRPEEDKVTPNVAFPTALQNAVGRWTVQDSIDALGVERLSDEVSSAMHEARERAQQRAPHRIGNVGEMAIAAQQAGGEA